MSFRRVPTVGAWDILPRLATMPEADEQRYRFDGNPAASPATDIPGVIDAGRWVNCCTFAAWALWLGQRLLGFGQVMGLEDWQRCMISHPSQAVGDPGIVGVAESWGVGKVEPLRLARVGVWWVCQSWSDTGGHTFFLRSMGAEGFVYLEANGQRHGGAWNGIDGVGSRSCSVRNARQWPDWFPAGTLTPAFLDGVRATHPTLHTARLLEPR